MNKIKINKKMIIKIIAFLLLLTISAFAISILSTQKKSETIITQEKTQIKQGDTKMTYPRAFSHIGLSVPNLEEAVKFYTEVMGWYLVMKPTVIKEENDTAIGIMCEEVFGKGHGDFKIAHLVTSNGIGIELFEFAENDKQKQPFQFKNTGMFHFSVQDPDIEGLVKKIVENGGKQRMPIKEYYPGEKPYKMCYVEDPFGIVFEVYTHSYEVTYSKGAY